MLFKYTASARLDILQNPRPIIPIRHGPVNGLRAWQSYTMTVSLFGKKTDATPLDVVSQSVRSYIDTTGPVIKVTGSVVEKP